MQTGSREVGVSPASAFYIKLVTHKLAMGTYRTEPVPCFCGSEDAIPVVEKDRYGIPYRMGLCRQCGLLYASPRMTPASSREFYQNEYRLIYDEGELDKDQEFAAAAAKGEGLMELLAHQDIHPKSVIDIGCNMGGMLQPFADAGATVRGIDYDPTAIQIGRDRGLPVEVQDMDDLFRAGVQAELVIMHHVLEHTYDLERTLEHLKDIMDPEKGVLYIGLPGLRTWDLNRLWQNAHTYQFCYDTLQYVMECMGYEALYCDEEISSIWRYTGLHRDRAIVHPRAADQNLAVLQDWFRTDKRRIPELKTYNKFPFKERKASIESAYARRLPDLATLANTESGDAIILCGGPSIDGELERIQARRAAGAKVIAIERMYAWARERGITPDYVVVLDASEDVGESLMELSPGTKHIVCTQVRADAFDRLADAPIYVFSLLDGSIRYQELWEKYGYNEALLLNAGSSVSLCAMSVAMTLGFRGLHVFGFDCHITQGDYARGITGCGVINGRMEIEVNGRTFVTTGPYFSFAQQFFHMLDHAEAAGMGVTVKIYGDSLVSALSKEDIRGQ